MWIGPGTPSEQSEQSEQSALNPPAKHRRFHMISKVQKEFKRVERAERVEKGLSSRCGLLCVCPESKNKWSDSEQPKWSAVQLFAEVLNQRLAFLASLFYKLNFFFNSFKFLHKVVLHFCKVPPNRPLLVAHQLTKMVDYYKVLEISRSSSQNDIKKA